MKLNLKSLIADLIETIIVSAVVILAIYHFIGSLELVSGASMEPNFHTGERILVDKIYKTFTRGAIVVLTPPVDKSKHFIKRIIGMPGDIIKILDCKVYISKDDKKYQLVETYLAENTCTSGNMGIQTGRSIKIPENSYVVLGDNRENSFDSRAFGVVSSDEILGRAVFRFWPIQKLGFIR